MPRITPIDKKGWNNSSLTPKRSLRGLIKENNRDFSYSLLGADNVERSGTFLTKELNIPYKPYLFSPGDMRDILEK